MPDKTLLFLCSGGGGNLRFIHQAIQRRWLSTWQRIIVITDRECPASDYARQHNLLTFCVDFKTDGQATLLKNALEQQPSMIITTIHRILNEDFVKAFKGKMLNLHYSLLPSFRDSIGANSIKSAINYGAYLVGATVHEVIAEVDAGRPITQIAFPLAMDDKLEEVMDIEFRVGCIALLSALHIFNKQVASNLLWRVFQIKGRSVLLNPASSLPGELFLEDFWNLLK